VIMKLNISVAFVSIVIGSSDFMNHFVMLVKYHNDCLDC
jgi:hypothetical protein